MFAKYRTRIRLMLMAALLLSQAGCVALNIPSERLHDPGDHGGLFGPWRRGDGQWSAPSSPMNHSHLMENSLWIEGHSPNQFHGPEGQCLDGVPTDADLCDPALDVNGHPKQPQVPWPRFHPVPTRPVFGATSD